VSGGANVHRSWGFENDQVGKRMGVAVLQRKKAGDHRDRRPWMEMTAEG
jgi:hypothetical protein